MNDTFHDFRDAGFREIYALYRRAHSPRIAFRIAYEIAFDGLPF